MIGGMYWLFHVDISWDTIKTLSSDMWEVLYTILRIFFPGPITEQKVYDVTCCHDGDRYVQ